jgi:hypothetical protein
MEITSNVDKSIKTDLNINLRRELNIQKIKNAVQPTGAYLRGR